MNIFSTLLFLLGLISASLLAIGMDPYSCGVPLLLMASALLLRKWNDQPQPSSVLINLLVLLGVVYFCGRMFYSSVQDFARSDALLLAGALAGYLWIIAGDSIKKIPYVMGVLWVIAISNVAVAMVQCYIDINFYPIYPERATIDYPSGLYLHYNHFANFLLGVGLLSLGYGISGKRSRLMRTFSVLVYLICVYGVYLSRSRGALLGLGCGTAVAMVGWLSDLWRRKVAWSGVCLVISTALAPLLIIGAWHVGSRMMIDRKGGDSGRLEMASMAIELIKEKPAIGGGSRSFFFDSFKKWNASEMYVGSGDLQYAHNEYLQTAVDYGLIGLIILLLVFGSVLFRGVVFITMGATSKGGDSGIAIGAIAAIIAMGVQAFFSFVYHVLPDIVLLGVCMGLLSIQPWSFSSERNQVDKNKKMNWFGAGTSYIAAIAIIFLSWRDGLAWIYFRPKLDFSYAESSVNVERLQKSLEVRPDFRYMSDLSQSILAMNEKSNEPLVVRKERLEKAASVLHQAVLRAPDSYQDILNLALIYDSLGKFEEAEILYDRVVDILDPRELFYGARFFYATHLVSRANFEWRKRNPSKALVLFLRARNQAAKATANYPGTSLPELKETIEKSIKFLEGANIQPEIENDSN
jgi:O-antigen ligase